MDRNDKLPVHHSPHEVLVVDVTLKEDGKVFVIMVVKSNTASLFKGVSTVNDRT